MVSLPGRNLEPVFVKCALPAKVDVATKFMDEEEGQRLVVNPETGRVTGLAQKPDRGILATTSAYKHLI